MFFVLFCCHVQVPQEDTGPQLGYVDSACVVHVNASAACDWLLTTTGLQQDIQALPSLRQLHTTDRNGCSSFKHLFA